MDDRELERIVDQFAPNVYRLAYARTGNAADAEDVMQEVFLRLVRKRPDIRDDEHCKAGQLRVTVNCAGDLHRAVRRRRTVPLEEGAWVPGPEPDGILEAVLTLPEVYRVPIHLFYYRALLRAQLKAETDTARGFSP